jgi:hypothetical protein
MKNFFLIILAVILVITILGFKERINYEAIFKNARAQMNALTIEVIKIYPLARIGFSIQTYGHKN